MHSLRTMVGRARLVALGEPAHGAHEPLALRNRIFRFLVEEMGFTAIAIESGLSESRRVYDFTLGGSGAIDEVVRDGFTWGFGAYAENAELVRWIREYNADPAHRRKIRFYGIDLSAGVDGDFGPARVAIDDALSYLTRADSSSARRMHAALDPYLERFSSARYPMLSRSERDGTSAAIADLIVLLERERPHFLASTSSDDYAWAHRNAIVARQLDGFFRVTPTSATGGVISPELYRAMNARDAAMADNVRWVVDREGPAGRVLVYAHNAHVMNASLEGSVWNTFARAPSAMGRSLRTSRGDDLFIIGTSSARNGAGLPKAVLDPDGIDAALARVGVRRFFVDLRAAHADRAVTAWLSERHSLRANFDIQQVVSPGHAFDALMFIDTLTKAGGAGRVR